MLHSPQFILCYITITGPDDDSMEATSKSVLLNTNNRDEDEVDQLQLQLAAAANKNAQDERIASDFVMNDTSLNAIVDSMRSNLIEGSCVNGGDAFEYVRDADIFVLSQSEFEASLSQR